MEPSIRYLLNPEETKVIYKQNIHNVIHAYGGQDFLREVTQKYISQARPIMQE